MSITEREQFISRYGKDKILHPENSSRLIEWMNGVNVPPITAMICPTDRCNHLCPRCVGGRAGVEDLRNMNDIVRQIAKYGVKSLVISGGGEPLLNKETPDIVKFARSKGMDIGLLTNGDVSLSENKLFRVIKNAHWIRISMDGSNPKEYKHSHGMDEKAFQRMLSNAKNMVRVRDKYGLTGCDIGTGYLTDKVTKKGMVQATKICKELGLSYIQFRPFFYDETDIDEEFAESLQLADSNFRVLRSEYRYDKNTLQTQNRGYKKCLSPNFHTTIAATGKVYICCHTMGMKRYEIGDLNRSSFKDIWESDTRQRLIRSISFKDCPPICKWHVLNNVLYNIKELGITTEEVQQISDSRKDEVYRTVRIL